MRDPENQGRSCNAYYELGLEVRHRHFCRTLSDTQNISDSVWDETIAVHETQEVVTGGHLRDAFHSAPDHSFPVHAAFPVCRRHCQAGVPGAVTKMATKSPGLHFYKQVRSKYYLFPRSSGQSPQPDSDWPNWYMCFSLNQSLGSTGTTLLLVRPKRRPQPWTQGWSWQHRDSWRE